MKCTNIIANQLYKLIEEIIWSTGVTQGHFNNIVKQSREEE
ncbi:MULTISPECIES: hypothetical protein [Bacillus]|nr:hypothetical protein [Bacillus pseudomycoides]EEM02504.1 hypothetical protein bmyco0002_51320 [Bacillus pseudomycoides]EEM10713.1 hypothetical protein bmyco0003_26040 [Bacillus pseudomycoides]EEM16276.1 hypothetical protein bpmyx0001_26650 [Bacillus pseudomycoides DSM 12442]MED1594442.1 hypothetical protein [Bacillus pseudomycoides]